MSSGPKYQSFLELREARSSIIKAENKLDFYKITSHIIDDRVQISRIHMLYSFSYYILGEYLITARFFAEV